MEKEKISISFLGGASKIGASCSLIEIGSTKLIIDAGIKLEGKACLPDLSLLNDKSIDAVLLTHAHLDHSGALPVISESFPAVPIYATPPTKDIVQILLYDSIKIMASEREGEIPLYGIKQIQNLFERMQPINFYHTFSIKDVSITFLPASHILGASMIHLSSQAGNILFTGDFSITPQATVPALSIPSLPVDCLITESTYGARLHENRSTAEQRLISKINDIINQNGIALIPCFAVGRAQEILLILLKAFRTKQLPKVPVYVDGMVRHVCNIYKNYENYVTRWLSKEIKKAQHPFFQNNIQPVLIPKDRDKIVSEPPAIIISSSGMLNGGASVHYAKLIASDEKNAILITGYQDEESPGKILLNLTEKTDDKIINLNGEPVEFKCKIEKYGLSAHADKLQIISFIESIKPDKIILVHGDDEAKSKLADSLSEYDTTKAYDGLQLEFSLPKKHKKSKPITLPTSIDPKNIEQLRTMLGANSDKPISARDIAKRIFGQLTNPRLINMLAEWLEVIKIARRDDNNRMLLWILPPPESQLESNSEEELLKKENPKGKLLEMCSRLKIEPPSIKISKINKYYQAIITLNYFGETIVSSPHYASSDKIAEHKASNEIIKIIEQKQLLDKENIIIVKDEDVPSLKANNFKGKLFEWCQANKIKIPTFEKRITAAGYNIKAVLINDDRHNIESKWHAHPNIKIAEHSACKELLSICHKLNKDISPKKEKTQKEDDIIINDPRSILNHLKQKGEILEFDLSCVTQTGPPHIPIFNIIASAVLPDGTKISTKSLQAHSKKEAQKIAALELINLIKH